MFKKALKRTGIVLLLIAAVFLIRFLNGREKDSVQYTQETEKFISNESLKRLEGSGYQKVAENSFLSVELNFADGNVLITDKESALPWRSAPLQEEIHREGSNDTWKNNLRSPIVYNYVTDTAQLDANYGNVYSGQTEISVYELEGGVRVFFSFLDTHITLGYDLRLVEDYLEISVPANLVSDTGLVYKQSESGQKVIDKNQTCLLTEFSVFPYLGAVFGENDTEGYLFVPDGIGGIMDFSIDGNATSQFVGNVYGSDLALLSNYDNTIYSEMRSALHVEYPVYGLVRDGNSFVAIIEEGETQADIVASKKGVQTGFHSIQSRFRHRLKYKILTNTATGDGYFTYSDFKIEHSRKILYHFDSGEKADYVQMAKLYRSYLIEKNGIDLEKSFEAEEPLQLYVIGGDIEENAIGSTFLVGTTFEQAKEMVRYLKEQGMEAVDVIYTGWSKGGLSVAVPDRFPIPSKLGGKSDLEELSHYVQEQGYRFYLYDEYVMLDSSKGVSTRKDTVYNIQDNSILNGGFANDSYSREQMEKCRKKYRGFALDGIEAGELGVYLYSDFNKNSLMDRDSTKQAQVALAKELIEQYGSVRLLKPNAYLVQNGVHFTAFPGDNFHNIIDETVPFYAIALHGLVTYNIGSYNNGFYEPKTDFLRSIEYGGNVAFHVTASPTSELMLGESFYSYSTEFDQWKEDIVDVYGRYQEFSKATAGRFIEDHELLSGTVTKVVYEGGVAVLINYSDEDDTYQGTTIPAEDFVIVR